MWFLIAICVVSLITIVGVHWRRRNVKHYPPGPRGLPFLGNLLQIIQLSKETKFDFAIWTRLSNFYGSILRVRLAMHEPIVVLTGYDAIMEFLNRREFDGRPGNFNLQLRSFGRKMGIVFNDGQDWIEQKRFVLKVLKEFGFGMRSMETLILEDVQMLCQEINENMLDKEINMTKLLEVIPIAVISGLWNLISGERCKISDRNSEMLNIVRVLNENFRSGTIVGTYRKFLPFTRYISQFFPAFYREKKRIDEMSNYFLAEVEKHKKTRIPGEPRDLIDTYLDKIESNNNDDKNTSFDELQLVVILKDFFSAGIETTANLIGFIIVYLAKFPHVQTKLQAEIDRVIGKVNLPRLQDKDSLPYLNATIAEVLRLANVAPSTLVHRVISNCSILGYDVMKNWSIIGVLKSIHMDPDHWGDPEAFRPERFIDHNGNFVKDPWLLPFGSGRRKCPGENLAKNNLFLFTAAFMQKFRFKLAPKETVSCLIGVNGFTLSPPPANIIIESILTE